MNSDSEDYASIEEMEQHFSKKISLLKDCLTLKGIGDEHIGIFQGFEVAVVELCNTFLQIKNLMKQSRGQLMEMKSLLRGMESLNSRLDLMQSNIPTVLKPAVTETVISKTNIASTVPAVSKKVEPTKILHLTLDEFKSIPSYMKGRLKYEQINAFIDTFNKIIASKYRLLSMPRKQLKPADYKKVQEMKLQETDATKNCYFCTEDNIQEYGNIKIDKVMRNFFSILRQCKRLREVRGPGPIIRYVVI